MSIEYLEDVDLDADRLRPGWAWHVIELGQRLTSLRQHVNSLNPQWTVEHHAVGRLNAIIEVLRPEVRGSVSYPREPRPGQYAPYEPRGTRHVWEGLNELVGSIAAFANNAYAHGDAGVQ